MNNENENKEIQDIKEMGTPNVPNPQRKDIQCITIIGEIEGKDAILVDDIIDTAGTITNAAAVLKEKGAKKVYGCATHGVLSGPAIDRIAASELEKFIITDTIPLVESEKTKKIEVVTVSDLFAEAINRINSNKSISIIFD